MGVENIKLGTSRIAINGTDVGYTSGGVSIQITTTKRETIIDHFGTVKRNSIIQSQTAAITFTMLESQISNLTLALGDGQAGAGTNLAGRDGAKMRCVGMRITSPGVTYAFSDVEIDTLAITGKADSELAYAVSGTAIMMAGSSAVIS